MCFIIAYMSQDIRLDEEQATQRRARLLGLNYADTSRFTEKKLFPDILSFNDMTRIRVVPLQSDPNHLLFGITTNTSQQTLSGLQQQFQDQRLAFALISDTGFREYMNLYNPPKQIVYENIEINTAGSEGLVERISSILDQVNADDMLAYLVQQAHRLTASDIHIETQPDYIRIRFRIDGVLHPIATLSWQKYRVLRAAIASAGNISTSADEAQQGHISQKVLMADGNEVAVNVRLETVPTINGMDVVMRLFNLDTALYTLDNLGLSDKERKLVDAIISRPTGLVMVVGPTGSGKTTTLYSMLNSLNTEERKIITVEDPVEYQFPGITQISVRTTEEGNDNIFGAKLRAVLRLDPDIVMVGEIRDMDTAKTALQAALTGHLVLSTFHASTAGAAITRLADIIQQNPLYVSAIRLIMAQRLVRKLDEATKQPYQPDERLRSRIQEIVDSLPESIPKPDLNNITLYKPGESVDNPYGYRGQIAIREQFSMTGKVRELLESFKLAVSAEQIEAAAIESGMTTMLQDGILKVLDGQTSIDEIFRVLG